MQIDFSLNLYSQELTGLLELISKRTSCSREYCVGQVAVRLFATQLNFNVITMLLLAVSYIIVFNQSSAKIRKASQYQQGIEN